jgi:hypothetical protein
MAYNLGPYECHMFVDPTLAGKLFTGGRKRRGWSPGSLEELWRRLTWPSPQGWETEEWHGPPDPVLDSGATH